MEWLLTFKQWLNPEFIVQTAGEYALPVLILIVFAETGLMAGFFLPGDSLLFVTGFFCALGYIPDSIWTLLPALTAAAVVGDQTGYLIGKKLGKALFTRPKSLLFNPAHVVKAKQFYDKHGGKAIILGRFVPIVRTFVPTVAGVAQMEYKTFVTYNVVGGVAWIFSMTLLGYLPVVYLPQEFVMTKIKPAVPLITLTIIVLSVVPVVYTGYQDYRAKRLKGR
jgi:membrane-associated protein